MSVGSTTHLQNDQGRVRLERSTDSTNRQRTAFHEHHDDRCEGVTFQSRSFDSSRLLLDLRSVHEYTVGTRRSSIE